MFIERLPQSECGEILASGYASTLAQSCHLSCLVATSLHIIASPKKKSVLELNDQSSYFHSVIRYGKFYGVTLPSVARISLHKRNSPELWLVHNPDLHIEVCGDNWRFSQFHGNIYFH
jgi:hypothetical protein